MKQHETMGRRHGASAAGRTMAVAGAVALGLALIGCGGDSSENSSDDDVSTETVVDATTTTTTASADSDGDTDTDATIGPPETIGVGDPATCEAIEAVNAADYEAAVVAARDVDPPPQLEDVWDDFLDGRAAFFAADTSDEDMDRYATAIGLVGAYAVSYCPLG